MKHPNNQQWRAGGISSRRLKPGTPSLSQPRNTLASQQAADGVGIKEDREFINVDNWPQAPLAIKN